AINDSPSMSLHAALPISAVATTAVYVAYTLDPSTRAFFKTDWLWPSTLLVVLGVWRFLHLVRNRPRAESPTQEMLTDGPFVAIRSEEHTSELQSRENVV